MLNKKIVLTVSLLALLQSLAFSDENHANRADNHAPISIMADHSHKKGEWMWSVRSMSMDMSDYLNGTEEVSSTGYMMNPSDMKMKMQMIGGMTAISEKITVMGMTHYISNEMKMSANKMTSEGIGDTTIGGIYSLKNTHENQSNVSISLGFPTGSVDEKNDMGNALGYGMQLGSGTVDIKSGFTSVKYNEKESYGTQLFSVIRTGKNEKGYRLGNQITVSGWYARLLKRNISISGGIKCEIIGKINGENKDINTVNSPVLDAANSGKTQVSLNLGSNYIVENDSVFNGLRIAGEISIPIYEDVIGYQMKSDTTMTVGFQKSY